MTSTPSQNISELLKNYVLKTAVEQNQIRSLWKPNLKLELFENQKRFINDKSKLKAALCSRRAGKSHCAGAYLILTAVKRPGTMSVYIALTRKSAKRIMWGTLKEIFIKSGCFTGTKWNNTELTVELPNGSTILLTGASDEDDMETLRGSKYALVLVDECASFKSHFQRMVEEVIEPALIDLDGTLALMGTPNRACIGYFYDATAKPTHIPDMGYSVHHWTLLDNPYIPRARQWLETRMMQKKWTKDHPVYLSEWCGIWKRADDNLVYREFNTEKNLYEKDVLPEELYYILGVDLGWDDKNAFVVIGFHHKSPNAYVLETFAKSGMLIDETAAKIKELQHRYNNKIIKMVIDTGGLGKMIAEELKARHQLPLEQADKAGKLAFIEVVNSDFNSEKVFVPKGDIPFIDELKLLQWDEKPGRRQEDGRFENHRCDAFLYAYREAKHYLHKPEPEKPKPGSKEYYEQIEQKIMEKQLEKRQQNLTSAKPWWESL